MSTFTSRFSWPINTSSVDAFLNLWGKIGLLQFSYESFARHSEQPAKRSALPQVLRRFNGPLKTGSGLS